MFLEFELKLSKSRQCAFQSNIESFLAIAEDLQLKGISDSNVEDTFATLEGPLKLDMNATFSKKPEIFKFRDQTTRPDNDVKPGILQNETLEMKPKVSDTDHSLKKVRGPYNSKGKDKTKQLVTEETARIVETLYSRRPDMVFTCLKCEYTSTQRGHLREHVEKHIEGLKYFCSFCNKKSSTSQSLRGHMQKYH